MIGVNPSAVMREMAGRFAELARVLRPGGRLVITVHRHVLDVEPAALGDEARRAGLVDVHVDVRLRQRNDPKAQLLDAAQICRCSL